MSNAKEEMTVHAEPTPPSTSATEPVNSSRPRVLTILFAIGMLGLGLLGGWMLAS